ncbi:ribonuclease H-like domain-containing protein [Streptomyces sp. NRRL S-350]|uniref:ribonuclease H-like domain-containing protein n=1 Tax=Streptomyces sp. NRRL S-350 TaxID=1463902 RepID=UPI0004C00F2A|nr:hypothetical protein [Streptomyces sp. NRRL S-350]
MIVTTNLPDPLRLPGRRTGTVRVASLDAEWTKNRRIKNGNKVFCYSLVWLDLRPGDEQPLTAAPFHYLSAYVEETEEAAALVQHAARTVRAALDTSDLLTGHQLCADLAVLNTEHATDEVTRAREVWHRRRAPAEDDVRLLDTRYDAGHLLTDRSRRLVDVCTELGLDVTQPELRGTSMTALHRRWLEKGDPQARERISVLNLRHSLSTALVAARAEQITAWPTAGLNVNQLLADQLLADRADEAWPWLNSPTFTGLLGEPCPSAPAPS